MDVQLNIQRAETIEELLAAEHLFDRAIKVDAAKQFLAMPGHYLLLAYVDGRPAGMVTGAEIIHPDIDRYRDVLERAGRR